MHCISCEILLEKWIKKIPWVILHDISWKKWYIEVNYETDMQYDAIVQVIEESNFSLLDWTSQDSWDFKVLKNIVFILAMVVVLMIFYILNYSFDLYSYLPDTNTLGYGWAFLVWIIASISTCLAITGGIIIWFGKFIDSTHSKIWHIKVQLWFQLWRVLWFFLLGWILWLTGQLINISFSFTGILSFLMWILFIYMGLYIYGILPSLSRAWIHMPKSFAAKVEKLWKPQYAPLVWALTFFIPCWFTQTLQLMAVASGSFVAGGLIMLFFALGTFPVLFSVWLGSSYFNDKKAPILNTIIAWILILFWVFTLWNSYNLLSYYVPSSSDISEQMVVEQIENSGEVKEIKVSHNGWNTQPRDVILEKWHNYRVVVSPTSNGRGCMSTQLIPKLKSKVSYVREGENIVYNFTSDMSGTFEMVCGSMGMLQGRIIIK